MTSLNITLIILIIAAFVNVFLLFLIFKNTNKNQLQEAFSLSLFCTLICLTGLIAQILLSTPLNIQPIYFDYFVYIGTCFLPIGILLTGKILLKTQIKFSKKYLLLTVIPILSLIILWTNDYHHLFYQYYSININDCIYGKYKIIHDIYSYLLLFIGIFYLLKATSRNSGFFSKQSLFIVLGISIPVITNLLGTLNIIPMTIYITPITFMIALAFFALAIFKFRFLGVAPIALRTIVNKMSDSFVVLNEDFCVTDFNSTFLKTLHLKGTDIREKNIIEFFKSHKRYNINIKKLQSALQKVQNSNKSISFEHHVKNLDKYFTIEINTIYDQDAYLGILMLFKDITQHKKDLETIRNNQDMLMEKERLASLGQLIGGISHNLKTPIMSISGAAEGLTDLIKEYELSIGDPEVTVEDHHAIANDMKEWISKIHSYTSYMSDIITAVKGQAVALSENEADIFTIDELFKRVNILMKHEISNASLTLVTNIDVPSTTQLHGDVNSLVQVVNNLITNAIQSYETTKGQSISLSAKIENNNIIISVADSGCGMPQDVQDKLFKSMITTKGKNGTGLGMFMSYSTIKGHFNGDITFQSEVGKGTTFNVIIPLP